MKTLRSLLWALALLLAPCSLLRGQELVSFDTIPDLLAVDPRLVGRTDGSGNIKARVDVAGRTAKNDGGGGLLDLVLANSGTTNTGLFFRSTANSTYAWKRVSSGREYKAAWFGAIVANTLTDWERGDDVTSAITLDSLSAVQAAVDYAAANGGGVVVLDAGSYRWNGTLWLKPYVTLRGAGKINSWQSLTASSLNTIIPTTTGIYQSTTSRANGKGAPVIAIDQRYFTNQPNLPFTSKFGDSVNYYTGACGVENLSLFPDYAWAWNGGAPSCGLWVNQVAYVRCVDVTVYGANGPGWYWLASLGSEMERCGASACFGGGIVITLLSDVKMVKCDFVGNYGYNAWLTSANTIRMNGVELWNNFYDLVTFNGLSTAVVKYGVTNTYLNRRTWSASASANTITASSGVGSDTALPIMFAGTSLPSPLVTNQVYYVTYVTNVTSSIKLATSPLKALSGTTIDILTDGTSGNWYGYVPNGALVSDNNEEVFLTDVRMDQNNQFGIYALNVERLHVANAGIWETALDQTSARFNRLISTNWTGAGIYLDGCSDVSIVGGIISGTYGYAGSGSDVLTPDFQIVGVDVHNSANVSVSGTTLARLNAGVRTDANSVNVVNSGHADAWTMRLTDSGGGVGNPTNFAGAYFRQTNTITAALPTAKTNLTGDWSFVWKGELRQGSSAYTYAPIATLGTGTTTGTVNAPNSLSIWSFWSAGVQTINVIQYGTSTANYTTHTVAASLYAGHPIELVVQRSGSVLEVFINGQEHPVATASGGSGCAVTNTIHASNLTLGAWVASYYYQGWMYGAAVQGQAYSFDEIANSKPWVADSSTLVVWDFSGANGTTVYDASGNNVTGTAVNVGSATPILWGTQAIDSVPQTGSGMAVRSYSPTISGTLTASGSIDLGSSDTTLARGAAGAVTIEGNTIITSSTIRSGTGTPEGAVTATVGTLFLRTDGGAGSTLYVKESGSGNTGWAAK